LTALVGGIACTSDDAGEADGVVEGGSTTDVSGTGETSTSESTSESSTSETSTSETDSSDLGTDEGESETGGSCYEQPAECAQLIECLGVLLPDQDLSQYEPGGACWCGSEAEALECYDTCVTQLELAIEQNPTIGECHGRYCPLEELDAAQPYGPPPCSGDAMELQGLPVDGSYCAPPCGGFAKDCPEHSQTIAEGTCYWNGGDNGFCALWCYVDPYIYASGTQCQCGATCQPYGPNDGDGNQRGICSFE
jgi:hypothetical protein